MQYALLIYSRPGAAEALSPAEREANHREYLDIRKLPGMVGGAALHPVETATTVRVQDGQTLVTDGPFADTKEIFAGFYLHRGRRPGPGDRDRGADPGRPDRRLGGDPARRGPARPVGARPDRADFPRRVGPGAGLPDRLPRRFRPGRGGRRGGVRDRGAALAVHRDAGQSRCLAGDHGPPPGHRPAAPRPRAGRQAPPARRAGAARPRGGRHGRPADPGRAARARLHVLPPGAGHRGAGGADAARGGRADHRGDRAGLPGPGRDDEAPADPRQVQDQGGRHPVRRPGRVAAARAARRGARRRLPHLQRGLQRTGPRIRPGRRGDPARPGAGRAAPGRAGGARAAGADAAARRAPRGPVRRPGPGAAAGPGPVAVGLAADRRGPGPARPRPARSGPEPGPTARGPYAMQAAIASLQAESPSTGRRSPRSTASSPTGPVRPWSG